MPLAHVAEICDRQEAVATWMRQAGALEQFRAAKAGSEDWRSARLLLEWQAEAQSARILAAHDEREIEWEATARASMPDGRAIPYQRLAIEIECPKS